MLFDRQRNFNRRLGILRRDMRDGQDGDDCRVIALARYAEDDDAGAVLAALFKSGAMFAMPEVCVIEDKLIVTRVHAGGGDRTDFIFGQIDGRKTAPLRRKRSNSSYSSGGTK